MNYAALACLLKYRHKNIRVENNLPIIEETSDSLNSSFNLNHLPIVMTFGIFNEKSRTDETSEHDYIIGDPTVS